MQRRLETASDAPDGVLLVGHGTREARGVAEFDELAKRVAARLGPIPVAPCFLELAEPTIAEGIDRLAAQGVRRLTVVPVLLFAAGHAKYDIPRSVAAALVGRPGITSRQTPHLGLDERVFQLAARRFAEAVGAVPVKETIDPEDTLLVVVGRGSRDPEALAEFDEFARRHAAGVGCGEGRTAFMSMAEPGLAEALAAGAASTRRRIVVQPHLLFGGVLVERVRDAVESYGGASTTKQWLVADHLGPDDLLVSALVDATTRELARHV
jgi:sirohydrochlorin ferrochelatase